MGRVRRTLTAFGEGSVLVCIGLVGLNSYQQDIPQYTYSFSQIQKNPILCMFKVAFFLLSSLYPKNHLSIVINTAY